MQNNRAKIFMPFDCLKGFKSSLERVSKIHDNKYLNEENIEEKINKLNLFDRIEIYYFYNFEYINLIGQVKKIDYENKYIIVSSSKIKFEDIDEIKKKNA